MTKLYLAIMHTMKKIRFAAVLIFLLGIAYGMLDVYLVEIRPIADNWILFEDGFFILFRLIVGCIPFNLCS